MSTQLITNFINGEMDFETLKSLFNDRNGLKQKFNITQLESFINYSTKESLHASMNRYNLSDIILDKDYENYIIIKNKIIALNTQDIFTMIRDAITDNVSLELKLSEIIDNFTELRFLNYVDEYNILNLKMNTLKLV